jgi:hypothetical protein
MSAGLNSGHNSTDLVSVYNVEYIALQVCGGAEQIRKSRY